MAPEDCRYVDPAACSAAHFRFGGLVDLWDPSFLPQLYSLSNCCRDHFLAPLLVPVPLIHAAACIPALEAPAEPQGYKLCFREALLEQLKEW